MGWPGWHCPRLRPSTMHSRTGCSAASLKDSQCCTGGGTLNKLQEEKSPFSPLSQNPRSSTLREHVDLELEPIVDLDVDQRGCVVFPKVRGQIGSAEFQVL